MNAPLLKGGFCLYLQLQRPTDIYSIQVDMQLTQDEQLNSILARDSRQIQVSKRIEARVKEAIACVGNQNRYQVLLVVYFSLAFLFGCFILMGSSYFFMNPLFQCNGKPTNEQQACSHLEQCRITNSYTVTAYAELYCGSAARDRQVIQSMLGIGAVLGVVLINAISDYRGRKFAFILALTFGFLSASFIIIGAFTKLTFFLIISQIFGGFTANSLMNISYVFIDKLMSKAWMNNSIIIVNLFWCFGEMMLILFTIGLTWQHLSIIFMLVPCTFLLLFGFVLLVEDPVLLFTKKRWDECSDSIKKIARINKTQDKVEESLNILALLENEDINTTPPSNNESLVANKLKYILLLKNPIILVPIVLLGLFNLGGNINYYILNYSMNSTGNSYGLNVLLFGVFELLGLFPMLYLNARLPRRLGLISIILIQIAIAAPFFFFQPSPTIQTVSIVAIRFFTMIQYALIVYLQVETFPQHIQSTSIGCIELIGQMGKFVPPFLVGLAENLEISPLTLIAISLTVFGIFTMIPIKQTLHSTKKGEVKNQSIVTQETSETTEQLLIN